MFHVEPWTHSSLECSTWNITAVNGLFISLKVHYPLPSACKREGARH